MPSNWLVFDRIRALTKSANVFRADKIFQDQSNLDRLTAGGDFLDFSSQAAILDQTNLQINRLERYKDYEQMDQTGEISLALDLYADEACLTGDTHIPLLDGTCPTIAELAERGQDSEFWVYSFDQQTGKYVPALAKGARITGTNVQIVCVTLDDGSKIRCTADHLFMMRDGTFVQACDLKHDDSLKPLYKKRRYRAKNGKALFEVKPYSTATAYEYFFNGEHFQSTHRWVYHSLNEDSPAVVHHGNFNSLDNTPANLKGMNVSEHDAIHRKYGKSNHSFKNIAWADIVKIAESWSGTITRDNICAVLGIGERVLYRLLSEQGIRWEQFRDRYNHCSRCNNQITGARRICVPCRKAFLHDYHIEHQKDVTYREKRKTHRANSPHIPVIQKTCKACKLSKKSNEFLRSGCSFSPYCNDCRPITCERRYLAKSFNNHKVLSVEYAGVVDKVYDIEVPKYHCFAAGTDSSWVIVHNSLVDSEKKHTLIIKARNKRLKHELEDLFYNILRWDNFCRPTMRYLCKYGDAPFEIILDQNRTSVAALRFMNVYNFTRIETRYGDLIGFFYMDALFPKPVFLHPWQVMHLRLTSFENIYHPYGRAILDGGRKAFKQLRLMEDAALIYRITRAPEKRKFTIPVGNIPAKEVPEYMQMVARTFKRQRFYNPSTGSFDERYSPLIQEDDFFLPRRTDGSGPDIDILPGAENLDQIKDIEYFKKKMIAPMKIPFNRVGIGDGAGEANEKTLSQSSSEFAKAVQWVQREGVNGLTKVAIVHLALRGYGVEDLKGFEISFTANSALEELYRIETWQTRVSVMSDLKDLGWFPKEWIVTHFTDLSPDEIEEIKELEDAEVEGGGGMGGGGGGGGMGGMPDFDLGGEEGGPEGGMPPLDLGAEGGAAPAGGEVGGEVGGEGAGGEGAGDAGEAVDAGLGAPAEGYDISADRRLILEIRKRELKSRKRKVMASIAERLHRDYFKDVPSYTNGYEYFMASKEFDGLSKRPSKNDKIFNDDGSLAIKDPSKDDQCLVEWTVDPKERLEAIRENYNLLISDSVVVEEKVAEITDRDLPRR
jgi:hypothetical protein